MTRLCFVLFSSSAAGLFEGVKREPCSAAGGVGNASQTRHLCQWLVKILSISISNLSLDLLLAKTVFSLPSKLLDNFACEELSIVFVIAIISAETVANICLLKHKDLLLFSVLCHLKMSHLILSHYLTSYRLTYSSVNPSKMQK